MTEIRVIERPAPATAVATLYCFPHAGGAAGEYARWAAYTPGLRLVAVQPPGRAHNLGARAFTAMPELVREILATVRFTPPFALFGHSLGALVAFEVAKALGTSPTRLFVSSCPPPPLSVSDPPLHLLDDPGLHAEIERRWGPLPAATGADRDLLTAALACYRADLRCWRPTSRCPAPGCGVPSPPSPVRGSRRAGSGRPAGGTSPTEPSPRTSGREATSTPGTTSTASAGCSATRCAPT